MNLYLVPASQENIPVSISGKVSAERAKQFLSAAEFEALRKAIGDADGFNCWAVTENKRYIHSGMQPGDLVFLSIAGTGAFNFVGRVIFKFECEPLGNELWPFVVGKPWKYIYVLGDLSEINVSKRDFVSALGHNPGFAVAGAHKVDDKNMQDVVAKYGSIDEFLRHFNVNLSHVESRTESEIKFELRRQGAGFGDPEKNKMVEEAAIKYVTDKYRNEGWQVESVETEKRGFDLICTKENYEEHVEVKGISGKEVSFIITANEVRRAQSDPEFVICAVNSVLSDNPEMRSFNGPEFIELFDLEEIAFKAVLNKE